MLCNQKLMFTNKIDLSKKLSPFCCVAHNVVLTWVLGDYATAQKRVQTVLQMSPMWTGWAGTSL